jgi:cellulose synthase/poly-beta-1,6-N-acetylglucosamine synthase-like glycosyltransferase
MRLARFGYRSEMIWSTTYEEAPAHVGPWLRQRTRWFKGWMRPVKRNKSLSVSRRLASALN